jgi:hypothetical protein
MSGLHMTGCLPQQAEQDRYCQAERPVCHVAKPSLTVFACVGCTPWETLAQALEQKGPCSDLSPWPPASVLLVSS